MMRGNQITPTLFFGCLLIAALTAGCVKEAQEEQAATPAIEVQQKEAPVSTTAVPIVTLEKNRYVLGESIRFWIGVEAPDDSPIPEVLWNTCFLRITKPDGRTTSEKVSWPADGMLERGWMGGKGLGDEEQQVGRYTLTFEFANQKTKPVDLVVEDLPLLNQITASFQFGRSGSVTKGTKVPVTLKVENGSSQPIRFLVPGAAGLSMVTVGVQRAQPPLRESLLYPSEKLPGTATRLNFEKANWEVLNRYPAAELHPGQNMSYAFLLADAYQFSEAGEYSVSFSTVLEIFVGKKDQGFADFCPIRLPVESTEQFNVSGD